MKFKQLLSVVLMLCMVASSLVAFAAPSYDASYNCSSISFGYEDGEVWTDASSLEGGQTITGKVTVSTTGEEENMVFSMFVYKNGKMIDGEICTLPVGSTAVEFKASADIPAEAEGCQLVAVLWNNFYDMKMICDAALFPGTNTKLRALYLDGVKLEGFDPDVTEYTYAIEPNAEKYPEITWETVDSAVKATYIAPKSFPGIAVVSVEGGNGEKTEYRVKYDTTVGDYISNVGGLATNPVYVKGGFKVGGTAYNDRSYYVTAINAPEYEGADMIQASIGWQTDAVFNGSETVDWITFDTARGVTVKVLKSDIGATAHFVEEGWTMEQTTVEGGFVQTTTNTVKNHNVAMSKHFNPGKVVIPNGKSGTTYLVAIILDPIGYVPEGGEDEPEVVVDETLDLASLLVDGVALEGFDAQTLTYNYSLIAEQAANVTAPVVTCTLADETSTVEIKAPKTFPGNATITVTNAKGNSRVYTIKYISEKVSGLALNETLPENTPVAAFAENFQAGATVFADRGTTFFATEINDAFAIGKDRIQLCAGWRFDEKPYVDIYKGATLIKDWLSFTVARDTIVTIYEDADNDSFYTGYEKETATDSAYIVAPYGTSPLKYDVKYSKVYKAGTKVEIPNANKSQRTGMIVLTYAPWGEEFDEGQVPDVPVVPDEPEDHALCLADLKIDGETVNGFAEDVFTFTHTLTSAQLTATDAPAITYTLADATSSAVVTKPDTFPGSAKITVTSKAGDSRTYTVNYAAELVADLATDVEGKNPVYVAGGIKTNGNVASDRIGTAETTWRILSYSEALAGNDTVLSNVEGWVGDVTEVKFTLARKAKVKVLLNDHAGAAASNLNKYIADGFTADPDTTNEKITIIRKPPNAAEDIRPYTFMATKVFEAGEVSVPYTKPNMPVVIAVEYLPWGGEFAEPIVPDEPDTPVVPDEPDTPVVPDEPEVDSLALSDIKVDGSSISGFAADVTEYNYTLTDTQIASIDAPAVTYTLADETSSAVVVNPTEFPGAANITVTDAEGNTRTYTVNYKASNTLSDFAVADSSARLPDYIAGGFAVGTKCYFNRNYLIQSISDESLVGKDFFMGNIEWQSITAFNSAPYIPWITFNSKRAVDVVILKTVTNGSTEMLADGFTMGTSDNAEGFVKADTNAEKIFKYAFTKKFGAGEVIIPNGMSKNAYFVVFKYAPWGGFEEEEPEEPDTPVVPDEPEEPVEVDLVTSISVDGVEVADFDLDTLEYTVTLSDDQLAADSYPEVTYEIADGAAAVVTNPVSFPGFAEIKVTKGTEEKTYKINYEVPKIQVNLTELAPAGTPKATVLDAMTIGTPVFGDRSTFPVEAINDPDIEGTLWLRSASGWRNDEKDYRNLYMGSVINDWISFEVKRGAVVTVYEDSISNTSRFAYWTSEASEETPYIKATHATPLNYIAKHQRYFAAGETVEIPNLIGSRLYTATIKYLGWNEEAPELDVVIPEVKRISYSDLIPKIASGANANVTPGMWNGLSINTSTKYQLSKEFDGITEPTEITLTTDKIAKGYGIIVVAPLNETDDKNVIVNPDGSELEWTEYNNIVTDYAYTNDGDEDFDPANATYGMRNDTAATYTGGKAYVYANMNNSDDMYITGSALASTRLPYAGELHWTDLPEEYLGCNYIVIPFDGGFDGGVKEFTFTVNQPVKIYVHSGSSNMTVTDTISNDAWASSQYAVTRRYQNVLDHLSCAYMLKKGYINKTNIVFDGKVGSSNGVRFNRYDVYENLKADCGSYVGWVIDPEKVEATGFTETINDYRYEEYLEAWVD